MCPLCIGSSTAQLLAATLAVVLHTGGANSQTAWYPETAEGWATSVDGAHRVCLEGRQQSPIDFPACPAAAVRPAPSVTWADQTVTLINNGHTVQLTPGTPNDASAGQMKISIGGKKKVYNLMQCHFHWGSEHSLASQQQVLEFHCVHQEVSDSIVPRYGVLGIFFELGAANSFLAHFEDALPTHATAMASRRLLGSSISADLFGNPASDDVEMPRRLVASTNVSNFVGPVDFKEVLNGLDLTRYWNYDGSFTTPPCTEAVDWYVLMSKATVSQAQLDKFRAAMGWTQAEGNFRNPQPLSGRTIYGCGVLPSAETDYSWYPYSTDHWSNDVSHANSVCRHGSFQSPINFADCAIPVDRVAPEITWAKQPMMLINNGHAVQMTAGNAGASRGKMVINRKSYTLLQCHWHWSSEHTVGQKQFPLEVHCVHQLDGTEEAPLYGVFGMFYELSDTSNHFLSQFEDQLPHHHRRLNARPADGFNLFGHPMEHGSGRRIAAGSIVSSFNGPIDFKELFNGVDSGHYWNYDGSFTTPPCTEAVSFYILMDRAPISRAQLDKFKAAIGWEGAAGNFRPPQPLHGRTVSGCASIGIPVIAGNAPRVKTKKCVDQTPTMVMQGIVSGFTLLLLLVVLYFGWGGLFLPLKSSETQSNDGITGSIHRLCLDLRLLENELAGMQGQIDTSNQNMSQLVQLSQQIRGNISSAKTEKISMSSFLLSTNFMELMKSGREMSRPSQPHSSKISGVDPDPITPISSQNRPQQTTMTTAVGKHMVVE